MRTIGTPAKFSGMPYEVRGPAPWLGQHTTEVLREAGLDDDEVERLYAEEVVFDQHAGVRS
jgi:crotonobetainyl-CoA:carnitine CoA-transferase CaiB-like acyl-CoA transferase